MKSQIRRGKSLGWTGNLNAKWTTQGGPKLQEQASITVSLEGGNTTGSHASVGRPSASLSARVRLVAQGSKLQSDS